jgi:hypothetical protein
MSWALVFRIRQYLKGSLWVLPILGGMLGAVLAGHDDSLERSVQVPASWQYSASTASSALIPVGGSVLLLLVYLDRFTHGLRPVAVAAQVAAAGRAVVTAIPADPIGPETPADGLTTWGSP